MNKIAFAALILCFILACSEKKEQNDRSVIKGDTTIQKTDPVKYCEDNKNISYTLKLPQNYHKSKAYPLVVFFDPHAQANKTINKYASIANTLDVILVCSNDSKNGLPGKEIDIIAQYMLGDLFNKYKIDTSNIFVAGFSGGAVVATRVAHNYPMIDGVIAIGSPMLSATEHSIFPFRYIGLVGKYDFNFIEMYKQEQVIKNNKHELLMFDGKHEWPKSELMQLAIRWQLANAKKKDDALQEDISNYLVSNMYSEEDLVIEQMMVHNYVKSIGVKDINWWRDIVAKKSTDAEIRSLNYVSMVCYAYINDLLKKQDLTTAKQLCELYEVVDPKNPDVYYFKGTISVLEKDNNEAIKHFEKAASLGFDDLERLQSNPVLQPMMQVPGFEAVIKKIKENSSTLPLS